MVSKVRENDWVKSQMITGIVTIIDSSVPLVPDDTPANQNPVKRQIIVINLSLLVENFQLAKQNTETPKTANEKGMGFPENISVLPKECSIKSNSNARLCKKILYTKNVVMTEIFA